MNKSFAHEHHKNAVVNFHVRDAHSLNAYDVLLTVSSLSYLDTHHHHRHKRLIR